MQQSFEVDGQKLRQLRVEKALSLRALKERSHRPARLVTIRKLTEALGVEPKELMKGEE